MDTQRKPGVPSWILPVAAVAAIAAMGVGGWLSLRALGPMAHPLPANPDTTASTNTDSLPAKDPPAAVHGRKSPKEYSLPIYPTSFDFHSMEMGPQGGSAAFAVKQGSAAEICRYYIQQLGASGWEYRWKRDTSASPGDSAHPITLKGTRVRWLDRKKRKQLTLLALDDPQGGRSAQAVLSWAVVPGAASISVPRQNPKAGKK